MPSPCSTLPRKVYRGNISGGTYGSATEDVVSSVSPLGTSTFTPLKTAVPGTGGAYTLDLPSDPTAAGDLIAWVDSDGDGNFTYGTEAGYFAVKQIDGAGQVINGFGSIDLTSMGYGVVYLVSYYDGETSHNSGFDIIGTAGFNFTVD